MTCTVSEIINDQMQQTQHVQSIRCKQTTVTQCFYHTTYTMATMSISEAMTAADSSNDINACLSLVKNITTDRVTYRNVKIECS